MAWKRRSRPCLALPPAESPSTMNISVSSGSVDWQSASLPGSAEEGPSKDLRCNGGEGAAVSRGVRHGSHAQ